MCAIISPCFEWLEPCCSQAAALQPLQQAGEEMALLQLAVRGLLGGLRSAGVDLMQGVQASAMAASVFSGVHGSAWAS